MNSEKVISNLLMAICVAAFAGLIWLAVEEGKKWEAFKVTHNCKAVAHISGSVMPTYGISSSGKLVSGVTTTPSKTGWLCDDGITYYR
jgi:hypothetical protein